ncbi:MAG TPA: 3-deoxy-D-manno-octulosonic acid transferase [Dissulfurispiraceae bacterium]|nr:3-deoxy-D-manno-octulosonic acid transferase [Dissulfurispiraceae bacterium]
MSSAMYLLYNILYALALAVMLPREYLKRPGQLRNRWFRERLGLPTVSPDVRGAIWVHAVSVGEVIASVPLIKGLKAMHPERPIVISTVTDTGQKVANERLGDLAKIIYIPFDMTFAVANAFSRLRPSLFIIMETELWPVIIHFLKTRGVPVLLMNGRLSDKSVRGYRKLAFFFGRVLNDISFFCMQNDIYAEKILSLGAANANVAAIGNFKFDTRPPAPAPGWAGMLTRPVIVVGSTHNPEEEIVLDLFERLAPEYTGLSMIIAPRHPERFNEVEEVVRKRKLRYVKRSEITNIAQQSDAGGPSNAPLHTMVIILNAMGELSSVYGAADIAVMGGSFIGHGGQNPLEPAYWGKPIVCGPHMENFPFINEFYLKGAAVSADRDTLFGTVRKLLSSPETADNMGKSARTLYDRNAGATDRALEIIRRFL